MGFEIFNFWWFHGSEKLFLTTKLLIKRKWQKIKKTISQIIQKNFCKIGLNPKELELLE